MQCGDTREQCDKFSADTGRPDNAVLDWIIGSISLGQHSKKERIDLEEPAVHEREWEKGQKGGRDI